MIFIIIGLPILAKIYWNSFYQFSSIGVQTGPIILVLWMLILVVNSCSSMWPKTTYGLFASAKTNEYFLVKIGGYILFTGNGSKWPFVPALWPFTFKTIPVDPPILTETFMVLTGTYDPNSQPDLAHQDDALKRRANHPFTLQARPKIKKHYNTVFVEQNGGGYDKAIVQYLAAEKAALSRYASTKMANQIADNRDEADRMILQDLQEMLGENSRDPDKFIGFDTLELRLVNPLLHEAINTLLLSQAETLIKRSISLIQGKTDKELLILQKEAEAKGISLIGFSEADVIGAKKVANEIMPVEEIAKRLGIDAGLVWTILNKAPEIVKNADLRAILMNSPDGQGLVGTIAQAVAAIKSIGDDFLKPKQ